MPRGRSPRVRIQLVALAALAAPCRLFAAEDLAGEAFWADPMSGFRVALAQAAPPAPQVPPERERGRHPPALPVGELTASLEVDKQALQAGETFAIRGRIQTFRGKDAVPLPQDLQGWRLALHRGEEPIFELPIKVQGPVPRLLGKNESVAFSAELPAARLSLYVKTVVDGLANDFSVRGPFPPSGKSDLLMDSVQLALREPESSSRFWARPRPKDEGKFGAAGEDYVAGELLLSFEKGVSLEEAEKAVAAEAGRIQSVLLNRPGEPLNLVIRFAPDITIERAAQRFGQTPRLRYAAPNRLFSYRSK